MLKMQVKMFSMHLTWADFFALKIWMLSPCWKMLNTVDSSWLQDIDEQVKSLEYLMADFLPWFRFKYLM